MAAPNDINLIILLVPPTTGLYFTVNNEVYLPGQSVNISDIGEQPRNNRSDVGSTLVCITTNVNTACCRSRDNYNNGSIGNLYYPNGEIVKNPGAAENFTKYVFQHQLRLSIEGAPEGPLGAYRCEIFDHNGIYTTANIYITNVLSGNHFI